jgi:hypothetical protein
MSLDPPPAAIGPLPARLATLALTSCPPSPAAVAAAAAVGADFLHTPTRRIAAPATTLATPGATLAAPAVTAAATPHPEADTGAASTPATVAVAEAAAATNRFKSISLVFLYIAVYYCKKIPKNVF